MGAFSSKVRPEAIRAEQFANQYALVSERQCQMFSLNESNFDTINLVRAIMHTVKSTGLPTIEVRPFKWTFVRKDRASIVYEMPRMLADFRRVIGDTKGQPIVNTKIAVSHLVYLIGLVRAMEIYTRDLEPYRDCYLFRGHMRALEEAARRAHRIVKKHKMDDCDFIHMRIFFPNF